jgi:hypothetical protein
MNVWVGARFGSILPDGHYGEIEMTSYTLKVCETAIQGLINLLNWKGLPVHWISNAMLHAEHA